VLAAFLAFGAWELTREVSDPVVAEAITQAFPAPQFTLQECTWQRAPKQGPWYRCQLSSAGPIGEEALSSRLLSAGWIYAGVVDHWSTWCKDGMVSQWLPAAVAGPTLMMKASRGTGLEPRYLERYQPEQHACRQAVNARREATAAASRDASPGRGWSQCGMVPPAMRWSCW
jgi:hypothetical protein